MYVLPVIRKFGMLECIPPQCGKSLQRSARALKQPVANYGTTRAVFDPRSGAGKTAQG